MNENEKSRMRRFVESPWGKAAIGAGAVGAIGLTVMVILRMRRHKRDEAEQLKSIARDASVTTDPTATLIESAQGISGVLGEEEAIEVATNIAREVKDDSTADALNAVAASTLKPGKRSGGFGKS